MWFSIWRMSAQIEQLVAQPHGIILVTGPTCSGKTTTLYAAVQRLDAHRQNIMTEEDPIEYELTGVGQTQVNAKIDLTFAKALRAILRQDPNVIMIGEIRDFETAQIAIQSSLTGHLVLATFHTNDAIRAQIHGQAAEADIRAAAQASGMVLMREDGQRLVDQGITSAQELARIVRDSYASRIFIKLNTFKL